MNLSNVIRTGSGSFIALLTSAPVLLAADLPERRMAPPAPPPIASPLFTWAGPYVGISAGADILRNRFRTDALATGFIVDPTSDRASFDQTRARLGGFVGYNHQIGTFVVGAEGDAAYDFGSRRTVVGVPGTIAYVAAVTPINDDRTRASSRYDASIRGRLGYLVTPTILAYATGGVAFRDSSVSIACAGNGFSWCSQPEFGSIGRTLVGYTVGGGVEGPVFDHVTVRAEYRYSDFGRRNANFFGPPDSAAADYFGTSSRITASTVTLGLAYRFDMGAMPAPVVARY